jgi:hypothetical protein
MNKKANRPLFFVGSSPSMAATIVNKKSGTAGAMVSMTSLRQRKSDFLVGDWLLDSGAFTEVARHGGYRWSVSEYYCQAKRWATCGNLLAWVSQDYMCEPFVLERTGLGVAEHQRLTIERYDHLCEYWYGDLDFDAPLMPVLQGFSVSDYVAHVKQYGYRFEPGMWVGVGSVCRRNGSPDEVVDILRAIKLLRPDLRLHGFGLKQTALASPAVCELLYSCDSMAWSFPRKFMTKEEAAAVPALDMAHEYQERVGEAVNGRYQRKTPRTAGAGNGQGRKPKWRSGKTVPIRIPEMFADKLLALAREWDTAGH